MAECLGINIYVVWKTTVVPFRLCWAFFSYNLYLRHKSCSSFLTGRYFGKNAYISNFFSKMAERWGIIIYVVWKTTIVPLSVCRAFLVIICICVTNHVLFLLTGRYFVKNAHISNSFSNWLGYKYLCRIKDHYSPLECMSNVFSYNLYLRDKSRSFFAHRSIFCKKCLHKQFFLKLAERWRINIHVVWKTTIVPLSVCRVFLFIIWICVTNHVLFLLTGRYFVKNAHISNSFSNWLGYKYLCRIKDHYSPLECMSNVFSYNLYLRDKSRSFFAHRSIFCKKCLHKQFFLKLAERWRINIHVVWKTTIVPLSVCRVFLFIIWICVTNHVLILVTARYFVKNAYISNFFSKWRNVGV